MKHIHSVCHVKVEVTDFIEGRDSHRHISVSGTQQSHRSKHISLLRDFLRTPSVKLPTPAIFYIPVKVSLRQVSLISPSISCKRQIYRCHYAVTGYGSNGNFRALAGCINLSSSSSRTSDQFFFSVYRVYSAKSWYFDTDIRSVVYYTNCVAYNWIFAGVIRGRWC
jgi:hypothetical protein